MGYLNSIKTKINNKLKAYCKHHGINLDSIECEEIITDNSYILDCKTKDNRNFKIVYISFDESVTAID